MIEESKFNEFMYGLKETVDKNGIAVMGVINYHSYSIGMAQYGFPDVIMVGNLNPATFGSIINILFDQWKKEGFKLGENLELISFGDKTDAPAKIVLVEQTQDLEDNYIRQALNFYEHFPEYLKNDKPLFAQILWPDKNGNLPDNKDYKRIEFKQVVLPALTIN